MYVRLCSSIVLATSLSLAACSGASSVEEAKATTTSRAIVSQAQADRAFVIARGIDYLPWGYTADGCYARALYMSMELATERIPSSAQYIWATGDDGRLRPVNGPVWGWHVAPMVKVGADGVPTIIDPSLFSAPEVARSLDTWIARNNPTPASQYATGLVQGSYYGDPSGVVDSEPIASFDALNSFRGADIEHACTTAWNYIADETPAPTNDALTTKRAHLVTRTRELITGLRGVSKLSDLQAADLSCGGHARPDAAPQDEPTPTTPDSDAGSPPTPEDPPPPPPPEDPPPPPPSESFVHPEPKTGTR